MGTWLSNISLKYKFWAVNAVAFVTTLLLVLYAVQLEQQARSDAARTYAQQHAQLLTTWPAGQPIPETSYLLRLKAGQPTPTGAIRITRDDGQTLAVMADAPSFKQVFLEHLPNYAMAVLVLMLAMLGASQLLIRFLLSQLNTLKDVMLNVEQTGDLSARVPLACTDEVGQMAGAFNAMQAGYQRVVNTVAQTAAHLDDGAARLASSMNEVQHGIAVCSQFEIGRAHV